MTGLVLFILNHQYLVIFVNLNLRYLIEIFKSWLQWSRTSCIKARQASSSFCRPSCWWLSQCWCYWIPSCLILTNPLFQSTFNLLSGTSLIWELGIWAVLNHNSFYILKFDSLVLAVFSRQPIHMHHHSQWQIHSHLLVCKF